jgi:adenosylcobinamide-GDP ribazoletransferase
MTRVLRPAAAAVTFLTSAPLGRLVRVEAEDVARGAWAFPVVGGAVGGLAGLVADVLVEWLPQLAAGVLAVAVAGLLTGAMHLDALADIADALGAPTRVRALEIMRDHAIGAFGATALIVVLVLDAALLGALGQSGDAALVGLAAGAAGRAAMLPPALALSYARTEEGQGRLLDGLNVETVVLAIALAGLLAVPAGVPGLWGAVAAALTATALALFAWRRFGGVTGDVLGATGKLAESAALIAGVAVVM